MKISATQLKIDLINDVTKKKVWQIMNIPDKIQLSLAAAVHLTRKFGFHVKSYFVASTMQMNRIEMVLYYLNNS